MKRSMIRTINSPITITTVLTALMLSTGFILASSSVSATSSSANATVHVPDACTLVSTLNTPHTATLSPGTSTGYGNSGGVDGIGQTTLKATCNDSLGFAIYAIGYTEDTFGNTNLVSNTKNNGTSTYTIATGTNTSGANSNWAMQINAVSGSFAPTVENSFDSSSYHNVPTTYTMVAKRTSATMDPADSSTINTGSSITTTYAAYISTEQAPDTYTGKVKYTMVHPNNAATPYAPHEIACTAGKICYQPSANDTVGTMGNQSATDGNSVTLYASNFSRAGYGFAGWSDAYDYETNPDANFYGPNQTITVPTGTNANGLSLYAVWIKSAGSLQSNATTACNSLTEDLNDGTADLSSVTALTDERDNNTYAIAKLADGKCWMIENLRLDNTASHNSDGSLAQGYNSSFIGLADPESTNFDTNGTANSLYSMDGSTAAPAITGSNTGYRFPRYNNNNTNSRQSSSSYSTSGNTYSMGNYYTWHAAIADTTHYSTKNQSIENASLCPAGWRLPKGGNKSNEANNEFWNLIVTGLNNGVNPANYDSSTTPYYTGTTEGTPISNTLRSYPNNFLYSGYFNGSSASSRSNYGVYWSSTVYDYGYSYTLYLDSSLVYPGTRNRGKYYGGAIRCTLGF